MAWPSRAALVLAHTASPWRRTVRSVALRCHHEARASPQSQVQDTSLQVRQRGEEIDCSKKAGFRTGMDELVHGDVTAQDGEQFFDDSSGVEAGNGPQPLQVDVAGAGEPLGAAAAAFILRKPRVGLI